MIRIHLFKVLLISVCCAHVIDILGKKDEFTLSSPAFKNNHSIPKKFTGDGKNISPELCWHNPPHGTASFVLIVNDPDADPTPWVHWLLINIPAKTRKLPEDADCGDFISCTTDFFYAQYGIWLYAGPFPPHGTKHHYHFILFALDTILNLTEDADKTDVLAAMQGHVLGKAVLIGTYER